MLDPVIRQRVGADGESQHHQTGTANPLITAADFPPHVAPSHVAKPAQVLGSNKASHHQEDLHRHAAVRMQPGE